MLKFRSILAMPWAYRLFGKLVIHNGRRIYVREYIQPTPGMRIMDIGCGPADILSELPDVEYVGIDISSKYIDAARHRYGARGTFYCEDIADTVVRQPASVDLVLATGILHHLDDAETVHLLTTAKKALRQGGRFVAFDGCWVPDQSTFAKWIIGKDRGLHVRAPEAYTALARQVFGHVESHVRHDLLRIPYTHHITICSESSAVRS